ncbi:lipoprotein [Mycoplasma mycoides]|uniref:lipoprotein n=1 Tax=Mycoplasma mycoides TaxID=2102 RepID=UPI001ED8C976
MIKLLTLLGSISIVASTASVAIACTDRATNTGSKEDDNSNQGEKSKPENEEKPASQPSGKTNDEGSEMPGDDPKPSIQPENPKEKQLEEEQKTLDNAKKVAEKAKGRCW